MKILASVMAIAVVLAWPAISDAASKKKSKARSAQISPREMWNTYPYEPRPTMSRNRAWDVWDLTGEYIGSDPDPFIRNELARNPPGREEDN